MADRAHVQIFDEKLYNAAERHSYVTVGSLHLKPSVPARDGRGEDVEAEADLRDARAKPIEALETDQKTISLAALRAAGIMWSDRRPVAARRSKKGGGTTPPPASSRFAPTLPRREVAPLVATFFGAG